MAVRNRSSQSSRHARTGSGAAADLVIIRETAGILTLILNRPEKNNALSRDLVAAFCKTLAKADRSPSVAAIVVAGNGGSFCAGADTAELRDTRESSAIRRHARATAALLQAPRNVSKPVIAAVHGYALGAGCGLAAACDLVIADPDARLGYPELRHGIVPALVMPGLVRRVGEARAFALAARAEWLGAGPARAIGLVDEVSAPGAALATAQERARQLAAYDRDAMIRLKSLVSGMRTTREAAAMEKAYRMNVDMKLQRLKRQRTAANGRKA